MNRLDKILADTGLYTRSQAKGLIAQGRVRVNGMRVKSGADKYPAEAVISVDGLPLARGGSVYIMMNKPAGVLSATKDREKTVLDLLPEPYGNMGLFPAGRLDKDTVGLLLLTNDGQLAHRLLHPKRHVAKRYYLETDLPMVEADAEAFRQGLHLTGGEVFLPAELEIWEERTSGVLQISEGKYHQVKRMLAARGKTVCYLKRLSMGSLLLDENLKEGAFRLLSPEELELLRAGIPTES